MGIALPMGCATTEDESDSERAAEQATPATLDERANIEEPGTAEVRSCDDFDTWCGATRPCGAGFKCSSDAGCGSNFFGTYPNCGVTATCYPKCVPI